MSKDMLGSLVRAAVGVPQNRLELLAKIASKFAGDSPEGRTWYSHVSAAVQQGLPQAHPPEKPPALAFIKQVPLTAVPAKKTKECLVGEHYRYRYLDIDRWLPKTQPACDAASVGVFQLGHSQTLADMFRAALKLTPHASFDDITKALKEGKHTFVLQQIDQMVEKQEAGDDVGLSTDGWINLFPVVNADGSVSAVSVRRYDERWDRRVYRLDRDDVWIAGRRLVLSNSAALAL